MNLGELRERAGATQAAVARQMGVTQSRISRIENAELATLETGTLLRFIEALGCAAELFVVIDNEPIVLYRSPTL